MVFGVPDDEYEVIFCKFKMAVPIWQSANFEFGQMCMVFIFIEF